MTWNFDMSAAPRDPKVKILVADPGSKPGAESVSETYWIPVRLTTTGKVLEGDRWSGFTRGREPVAWMPMPEYPFESPRKAAEAVPERAAIQVEPSAGSAEATREGQPSETVANSAESASNDGSQVETAGETALHFHLILDDVGSGA